MDDTCKRRNAARAPLAMAAALLLAGCGSMIQPMPSTMAKRTAALAFKSPTLDAAEFDPGWWSSFQDPALSRLIDRALASNLDMRLALERVDQARAGMTAISSRSAPTIAAVGSMSRSSSGLPDDVKRGMPDTRAVRGAIDLSWEVDVFGSARAARNAATADFRAAESGTQAARLLVASEVARQYFIWQGARLRQSRLEQLLGLQADLERLTRSKRSAGQASDFDVSRAAGETRALAAQLPSLKTLATMAENQLATLMALAPAEAVTLLPLTEPPRMAEVPVVGTGQPIELLQRRPDLVAANHAMVAEAERLQESQTDLLPKFFITALFGGQDLELNGRDLSPVRYNNLALAFSMPLFNRGRLQALVDRQASRQRVSVVQFERAVLSAMEDVENSLVALQQERTRFVELKEAESLRLQSIRHANSLLREGQIDQLQWIDAQRALVAATLASTESQTQQLLAAVQLYKAMGGGWLAAPAPMSTSAAHTSQRLAAIPSQAPTDQERP